MSQSSFGEALSRLWPSGDAKIPRLRAGITASAPSVFAKYGITTPLLTAHVMAQISHDPARAQCETMTDCRARPAFRAHRNTGRSIH
jgi:hypothetical protein